MSLTPDPEFSFNGGFGIVSFCHVDQAGLDLRESGSLIFNPTPAGVDGDDARNDFGFLARRGCWVWLGELVSGCGRSAFHGGLV